MDIRGRRSINKAAFMWAVAALLLLIMATPALSTIFAAPGSVNTRAIVNGAVKTKKIANGAVNSAKIKDGSVVNADVAAGAAIGAAKINRTGLNADLLDGKDGAAYVAKTGDQTMAGKLTASSFGYSAPKTSYLSIGAAAFNPSTDAYSHAGLGGGYIFATGTGPQYYYAPVQLPHGAVVKSVRFRAIDTNATYGFTGKMWRFNAAGAVAPMALVSTSAAGTLGDQLLVDATIGVPVIDNQNHDYVVEVWLQGEASGSLTAGQVMITYETSGL